MRLTGRAVSEADESKSALRRAALARRAALPAPLRAAFAARLAEEGLRLAQRWRPGAVAAYSPIRDEPDALPLIARLAAAGFATALPRTPAPGRPLEFRLWRPGEPLRTGRLSIPEPLDGASPVEPDLLFLPLACFDRKGVRVGYGAGYYDRTLERLRKMKPVRAVGVAFGVCEVAAAPYEPHDQLLDAIVTEEETILVGAR